MSRENNNRNNLNASDFIAYPNPVSQTLFIESSQLGSFKLMDIKGVPKHEEVIVPGTTIQVNVKNYPSGVILFSLLMRQAKLFNRN